MKDQEHESLAVILRIIIIAKRLMKISNHHVIKSTKIEVVEVNSSVIELFFSFKIDVLYSCSNVLEKI